MNLHVRGMFMNKKGFTLIELIAVIVILAILLLIVAPNIMKLIERSKKEQYVSDAKELVSLVKMKSRLDKYESIFTETSSAPGCYYATALALGFDIKTDPNGDLYNLITSQAAYCIDNNKYVYYIKLYSTGTDAWSITGSRLGLNFLIESELSTSSVSSS